jgi:hypothetical protein
MLVAIQWWGVLRMEIEKIRSSFDKPQQFDGNQKNSVATKKGE